MSGCVPPWERKRRKRSRPVEPWAFIRAHNEARTLGQTLNSIEGVITRGVIGLHGITDDTDVLVSDFCSRNKGFTVFHYPHSVVPPGDPRYASGGVPYLNSFAAFTNAVWEQIPDNEWAILIDADMVYHPGLLKDSFYLPSGTGDMVSYSRLNLVRVNGDIRVIEYCRPGDHWLIYKTPSTRFVGEGVNRREKIDVGIEVLLKGKKNIISPECSSIHFPYEKSWKSFPEGRETVDLSHFLSKMPAWEIDKTIWTPTLIRKIYNLYELKDYNVTSVF